jgi:DNA transposition AAA+ family ATPase
MNSSRSNRAISGVIRARLLDAQGVLVIDEAQWCSEGALEELRAIHDETGCGLVLAGNREVLTRLEGKQRAAAYAQLFSRISFRHVIERPEPEDVNTLLDAWNVTNPKERDYLARIASRPGGGGLRQMSKVLELASITALGEGDLEGRCLTHVEDAAAQLNTRLAA